MQASVLKDIEPPRHIGDAIKKALIDVAIKTYGVHFFSEAVLYHSTKGNYNQVQVFAKKMVKDGFHLSTDDPHLMDTVIGILTAQVWRACRCYTLA